jgi:hypothetical protein
MDINRWKKFTLCQKLGNLGSEVSRAAFWKEKNNAENEKKSLERCMEMAELLMQEPLGPGAIKELGRQKMIIQNNYIGAKEIADDYAPLKNALIVFSLLKKFR